MHRHTRPAPKRTPLTVFGRGPVPVLTVPAPAASEEVSSGGIVMDFESSHLDVAVIGRLNRAGRLEWCLPKGHPEGAETLEQAALREVFEETGIHGRVLAPLGKIDYWFSVSGSRIHKTVHHYLMRAVGGELSIENDPDHEAVDIAWVPLRELGSCLSFPNERKIVDACRAVLPTYL